MSDTLLKQPGKPGAYPDPVALADKIAGFVDWCEQTGRKVLVEWLMYYLDLSDEQAADLKARDDESSEIYKKAVSLCRGWLVDNAAGGSWRDSVAIFCLKNHYGYTDSSKVVNVAQIGRAFIVQSYKLDEMC